MGTAEQSERLLGKQKGLQGQLHLTFGREEAQASSEQAEGGKHGAEHHETGSRSFMSLNHDYSIVPSFSAAKE